MKKILTLFVFSFFSLVCVAGYADDTAASYDGTGGALLTYKVTDAIKAVWGNPKLNSTYIQDVSADYGEFRIKQGWNCCGEQLQNSTKIKEKDDQAIIAFVANNITEHGAEFCLMQLGVGSSSSKFYLYHQQPRWPGLQCAWFCEPGWDGVACMERTSPETACNTTDYRQRINNVKSKIYEGNDAIALTRQRMGVFGYTALLDGLYIKGKYPHEIVVGAVDFMEHGIVAKPILVAAIGDHPAMTGLTTSGVAAGKSKVLCAQGFTADEKCTASSKNCGKTLWCSGYKEDVYKSKSSELEKVVRDYCVAYVCAGDKALNDDLTSCVECKADARTGRCDVAGHELLGQCKKCATGTFFNSATCECDAASAVASKEKMQYGNYRTDVVTNQCWAKENDAEYKLCVMSSVQ